MRGGRRCPAQVLGALGVRYDPLARRFQPPDEATFRRVLEAVDAAALEAAVGSWLDARLRAGRPPGQLERRAVAVDGKAVRGTWHASGDGQARHLLAVAGQQAGAVLAQAEVDGKTNEITCFAPLLAPLDLAGAVVTADAMHAQAVVMAWAHGQAAWIFRRRCRPPRTRRAAACSTR